MFGKLAMDSPLLLPECQEALLHGLLPEKA